MLREFETFVMRHCLFDRQCRILAAVSGGIDSAVLCRLLHDGGYKFAIAHCNFHLRPSECDRDEAFVRAMAAQYGVECYVAQFDTKAYAAAEHLSVEEAARKLRYDFFSATAAAEGCDRIVTAHHRDDSVETFFLNLMRGAGIGGLHGILPQQGIIVRPMLPFSRIRIEEYAAANKVDHVEDSTNSDTRFRRNAIRHRLMPLLRALSPSIDEVMQQNIENLRDAEIIYRRAVEAKRRELLHVGDGMVWIDFVSLMSGEEPRRTWLYEMLKPYGFTAHDADTLLSLSIDESGQIIISPTHTLVKNRGQLLIARDQGEVKAGGPQPNADSMPVAEIQPGDSARVALPDGMALQFALIDNSGIAARGIKLPPDRAVINADNLAWPLHLRHWRAGDSFHPFGMKGRQLLSDYFTDHKFSLLDKERVWLLCNADDAVLWIVGHRAAEETRVTDSTSAILIVELYKLL